MKNAMLIKVFAALGLAVVAGCVTSPDTTIFSVPVVQLYGLVGKLFLNALMLVVVPLVCSSIIIGTARMGSDSAFKTLGTKTFLCFVGTVALAVLVGYILMITFQPGSGQQEGLAQSLIDVTKLQELQTQNQDTGFQKIEQLLLRFVPTNILAAAAQGQMLGLIVFCMLFGYFLTKIESQAGSVILSFFQGVFQIMMHITQMVMKALPVGVFGLVAKVIAMTGMESVKPVASFFAIVLLALLVQTLVVFPLLLKMIAGINPIHHFKAMAPALLTAFSTSSSAATMPVTIECLEKKANVSPRICGFTIPLGSSVNMPGTAIYVCCAVFFIAQVYHIDMSIADQCIALCMIMLTSFGIAGVPSASLFAVVTVLAMTGLPSEGLALILAVERLIDMCRTTVNVFGNSCCTVLIESFDKQSDQVVQPALS